MVFGELATQGKIIGSVCVGIAAGTATHRAWLLLAHRVLTPKCAGAVVVGINRQYIGI